MKKLGSLLLTIGIIALLAGFPLTVAIGKPITAHFVTDLLLTLVGGFDIGIALIEFGVHQEGR